MIDYIDWIFFVLTLIPVSYIFIPAFASIFDYHKKKDSENSNKKFILLFPYEYSAESKQVTMQSISKQKYSADNYRFETYVNDSSHEKSKLVIDALKDVIQKAHSTEYDGIIILDEGCVLQNNFLKDASSVLNNYSIIQTHPSRIPTNIFAQKIRKIVLDIYNSIYKKGAYNLGYSSELDRRGIILDISFLRKTFDSNSEITSFVDLQKHLRAEKQNVYFSHSLSIFYPNTIFTKKVLLFTNIVLLLILWELIF